MTEDIVEQLRTIRWSGNWGTLDMELAMDAAADEIERLRLGNLSLVEAAERLRSELDDLNDRIGDLQASEAELVAKPLRAEIEDLRQAIWDAYGILGFDQDGDKSHKGLVSPPWPDFLRQFATQAARDYDEACEEAVRPSAGGW